MSRFEKRSKEHAAGDYSKICLFSRKKNEVYSRIKMWGVINKMKGRQLFIKEKLLPKDKELQVYANDKNLLNRTQYRQIQLLIENKVSRQSIDVNSLKTISDNITIAVQK